MNTEEVLTKHKIEFVPRGGDLLVRCLNPDHEDRHPSMRIDKITGVFNCFSCSYKGNIFDLFKEYQNILQVKREKVKKLLIKKRSESIGLDMPNTAIQYEGTWRGISEKTYKQFKAFQSHETKFIGRVVFPIYDLSGRIKVFVGRHMSGGSPKYLITPEQVSIPLYPTVEPIQGSVILVEGLFDMLNLIDKGLTNAICCFGCNTVNKEKLNTLMMQNINKIYIFFDGDTAGQQGASKLKELCESLDINVQNIYIADKDPGELSYEQVQKLKSKLYA